MPSDEDNADERSPAESAVLGPIVLKRLWFDHIVPEVKRRGITVPPDDYVQMGQILHQIGQPRLIVRLNEEVTFQIVFRYEGPTVAELSHVPPEHIGEILNVGISEELAGHEVIIRNRDGWWVSFDFRYYRTKIMDCVETAGQFLYASRAALEVGGLRAFTENLYLATEQLAWAQLLFIPHDSVVNSKSHGNIVSQFNRWTKMGNASPMFTRVLNRLAGLRNAARYRPDKLDLTEDEGRGMIAIVETALRELSVWRPSRAMGPFPLPAPDDSHFNVGEPQQGAHGNA